MAWQILTWLGLYSHDIGICSHDMTYDHMTGHTLTWHGIY